MKIRFTWPLFVVLLVAGVCAFVYSCRVKESFKGMQEKQETAKPANSAAPPKQAPVPADPMSKNMGNIYGKFTIHGDTITLAGQRPQAIMNKKCNQKTGECTLYLEDGTTVDVVGHTIISFTDADQNSSINPSPTPSSSPTKATPGPFTPASITITCPNGEQSTTGCCANGEPQGKYPCCPDGTPSREGKCN